MNMIDALCFSKMIITVQFLIEISQKFLSDWLEREWSRFICFTMCTIWSMDASWHQSMLYDRRGIFAATVFVERDNNFIIKYAKY